MKTEEEHQRRVQWKRRSSRMMAWTLFFALLLPLVKGAYADAANLPQNNLCIHHPEHTEDCGYVASEEEGLCTHKHDESCGYIPPEEGNTCTHVHDDACGYAAPREGSPCTHEHDEDCGYAEPEEGSPCAHEHDDSCGYREASDEIPCDMGCAEIDDEGNIIHQPGCAYTPAAEGAECTHEHDESCGYAPAGEGSPCIHEHDDTCGYVPAEEGSPCTHEHDDTCGYIAAGEGSGCTHVHDDTCGFMENTGEKSCNYVCELCVTGWKWNDENEMLVWSEDEKLWGLGVPGTDEEHPLTREELAEFLPKSVEAETAAGSQTVDLLWDLDKFPDSAFEGEFTVNASLSGEYVLTEDAPALEVLVALGGGESYVAKRKFLNQWSFIGRDGAKLTNPVLTASMADLESKERDEIIQWLKDTVLPEKIRGWTFPSDPDKVFQRIPFDSSIDQGEEMFTLEPDGEKKESKVGQWGLVNIQWDDRNNQLPDKFTDGITFTLQASIPTVTGGGDTYNIYVNSNDPADYKSGSAGKDTSTNSDILSLKVTLRDSNHKVKYLNQWSFINRDETNLSEDSIVTAAIANLRDKSREEVIQWLKDTVLPMEIKGWVSASDSDGVLSRAGFKFYDEQSEEKYETTADNPKKPVTGEGYKWGHVNVQWKQDSFPADFTDGGTFTLQAEISEVKEGSLTYNIYVNSNKSEDYRDASGNPSDVAKDTQNKPEILSLKVTMRNIDLGGHTVTAANPANVKVNLFDYWAKTEKPSADTEGDLLDKSDWHIHEVGDSGVESTTTAAYSTKDDWNLGINQGHLLLFGDGMIHAGLWNKGAGEGCRYGKKYAGMEEIVKNVLNENGYPELNLALANKILVNNENYDKAKLIKDYKLTGDHDNSQGNKYESADIKNLSNTVIRTWGGDIDTGTESLQYLFDPKDGHPFKSSFTDVKGLFQLDNEGYYYYDMRKNFAEFSQDGGNNHFILYDAPATIRTDGNQSVGNFFPFNKGYEVFNGMDSNNKLTSTVYCARNAMNHHLGMTVDVNFRQPANGQIHTGSGDQPMTFQFAGDDDVWVFIDDVLVLDLGGIHSELYGTIDFFTGDVYIGRAFGTRGIPENPSDPSHMVAKTTLLDAYKAAGKVDSTKWAGNTFASNTSHTLKMFYLERGNYDSSIALRFNLQPLLHQRIVKVDQNGRPLPDVSFELYPASVAADESGESIRCLYTDSNVGGGTPFYVRPDYSESADPLVTLKTDENGTAVFLTEDGSYFNFADRGDQYYVLREIASRNGYRNQPIDIVLYYDSKTSMLSVANRWTTGAYACSVSNVTGPVQLNYGKLEGGTIIPGDSEVSKTDQENGLVVAVPLLQRKSDHSWIALYGSNLGGFYSEPINADDEDEWRRAVLTAALKQAGSDHTADWHLDWDGGNSRLYGTLNDLPGLASRYQLVNSAGDMHMVYGIISRQGLKSMGISGGTAGERYDALRSYLETHPADMACSSFLGSFQLLSIDQFNRDFRSLIYIPNERRELRVQKVDQDGQPLRGTQFGLFSDEGCSVEVASGTTDADGMLIFSPEADNSEGHAQMVWANSNNTRYFLKETRAPAGYDMNNTVVPVIVGIYSIYADAGSEEDGVSVMAGVGRLTQTMRQYAIDSDVDITLQDITAFMQTQPSGSFQLDGWQDAEQEGADTVRSMNLHFGLNAEVDYGLHDEDGGKIYKPFFIAESGFVRARVEQNYAALAGGQYEGAKADINKDNLGDTDLTNLFSLLNTVVVTDRNGGDTNTGRLTISKELTGSRLTEEDYARGFTFTVEFKDSAGNPLSETFQFYNGDKAGHIASGGELVLRHGETITISGLPTGTRVSVTEKQEPEWYVTPASGVVSGEITKGESLTAKFSNSRDRQETEDQGNDEEKDEPPAEEEKHASEEEDSSSDSVKESHDSAMRSAIAPSASPTATPIVDKKPVTGDESRIGLWVLLGGGALLGLALICFIKYRRKKDSGEKDSE